MNSIQNTKFVQHFDMCSLHIKTFGKHKQIVDEIEANFLLNLLLFFKIFKILLLKLQ